MLKIYLTASFEGEGMVNSDFMHIGSISSFQSFRPYLKR
jgi:hypothetical protein